MKYKLHLMVSGLMLLLGIQFIDGSAQDMKHSKKAWPDSLISVTIEGKVIIDTTHENIYYLDVDNDAVADYKLAFGPDYYMPPSGAVRPAAGDFVTVVGMINPHPTIPVVIVFEINGLLWREAVENWWQHQDWCDSLQVITVSGSVLVDTTYYYQHYYLDVNGDQQPDYFLSFGPPWYEPESGALRPAAGETVTIAGALKTVADLDRLVVLTINDLVWRDPYGPAPWTGGWIGKERQHQKRIYCPIDSLSWIEFPPGALKGGGKSDPQFPDSIFCEFMQIFRDSLPGHPDSSIIGWHFLFTNPAGKRVQGQGNAVRFVKRLRLQLNCCNGDSNGFALAKSNADQFVLKYWDETRSQWIKIDDVIYDVANQSLQFSPDSLIEYYAIFQVTDNMTRLKNTDYQKSEAFALEQNYPNPFNPTTTIAFQVSSTSLVKLTVYNMLGQEVRSLINEPMNAGSHQINWDGRNNFGQAMPSGFYLYRLTVGDQSQMRRMVMMK